MKIAEYFGKDHKNVLQAIRNSEFSEKFNRLNFQPTKVLDSHGREQPAYTVSEHGFISVVMKFTSKKAAQIQVAFINAFISMREKLRMIEEAAREKVAKSAIECAMKTAEGYAAYSKLIS